MMWFKCTDNGGFEDQLTTGHMYQGRMQGGSIKLVDYVRFQLGEGIEKEESDFAAEVAAAVGG